MFRLIACLFCINFFIVNSNGQGTEIKIKIPVLKDSSVLLGYHFAGPNTLYPNDTIRLDKKGMGVYKNKKNLPGGMYVIFIPATKKYFDFFLSTNQVFTIEADTADFLKTVKFTGSEENTLFYQYQNFLAGKREIAEKLFEVKKKSASNEQKDSITKALDNITKEVTSYTKKLISDHSKLTFTTFLKALQEIEVPDPPKNAQGKVIDSAFQFHYYHKHYFDNFDYADVRLLRTPVYEQKIKNYLEKVIPPISDSANNEVDIMLERSKGNDEVFKYMLVTLFNHYASSQIMGMDAAFVHIAEKWYLPFATWSDQAFKDKLQKEVKKKKPNLIGNIAPDLKLIELPKDHFLAAQSDTALKNNPYVGNPINLHDIQAKYLIVVFWEADCGHCKKAIPQLYDTIYPGIKDKGVKLLAIHMIASVEGKRKWIDFVNEHKMYDWINAWSPYSYEYKDLYDVYTTPVIYVLDENKKIIAKRLGPEQVAEVINFESKKNKK